MSATTKLIQDSYQADREALERLAKEPTKGVDWSEYESDDPTPEDSASQHRTVVRMLKASLEGQAVIARVMLRHDDWLNRIGKLWSLAKQGWPVWLVMALRPEIAPEWLRTALKTALEAVGGQ